VVGEIEPGVKPFFEDGGPLLALPWSFRRERPDESGGNTLEIREIFHLIDRGPIVDSDGDAPARRRGLSIEKTAHRSGDGSSGHDQAAPGNGLSRLLHVSIIV
jgi:hypothetical protein